MTQPDSYLFVYGSLRSGFHHPAYDYITKYFNFVANAKVKGLLYDLGEYPAAAPSGDEVFIIGELYKFKDDTEFNWAIAQLDDYEGLNTEAGETPLFRREITTAYHSDIPEETQAWMYWFNGDITGKPLVASGDVLEYFHEHNK